MEGGPGGIAETRRVQGILVNVNYLVRSDEIVDAAQAIHSIGAKTGVTALEAACTKAIRLLSVFVYDRFGIR